MITVLFFVKDEADILGDRIAIMAEGKLQCVGSALFLKGAYGVGYTLTIAKNQHTDAEIEGNGNPTTTALATTMTRSAIEDRTALITAAVRKHVPIAEPLSNVGAEQSFRLPFAASTHLADMFEDIDANRERLGVMEYGISVTTLEEVFMRVGKSSHSHPKEFSQDNPNSKHHEALITEANAADKLVKSKMGT